MGFEQGGSFYFFLTDALGSVRDIVSGTDGAVLQSYQYTENGEKTASTSLKSDKTWVGGYSVNDDVGDSGLYLMGHRHYDSSTARFLSRDPIGFAGGLNLYSYGNSPVTTVDPLGLEVVLPTADEVRRTFIGVRKIGIGAGLIGADGPAPIGDAAGAPMVASGAKDVGQAMLEYLRRVHAAPPTDPCKKDDDNNDDHIFYWRNEKWRGDRAHFAPSVYARGGMSLTQFQDDWLDDGYSQYAGPGNKPGREIWNINNGGKKTLELVIEPETGRTVRGIPVSGSFITVRRFYRK